MQKIIQKVDNMVRSQSGDYKDLIANIADKSGEQSEKYARGIEATTTLVNRLLFGVLKTILVFFICPDGLKH